MCFQTSSFCTSQSKKRWINSDESHLIDFLLHSFPNEVEDFRIFDEDKSNWAISPYKEAILSASANAVKNVGIWDFKLNCKDFKDLVEGWSHVIHLDLYRTKFANFGETDVGQISPDLKFHIQSIDLRFCTGLDLEKIEKMVKWISTNVSLQRSMEYVWLTGTALDADAVQRVFTIHEFNVIIWP